MSSMKNILSLSKYMLSLPQTKISLFSILFLSFIVGSVGFIIDPIEGVSLFQDIIFGGASGFLIFGITSVMSGAITRPWVNSLNGRKMKMKQSMFLALVSMLIISVIYLIGCTFSRILGTNLILDSLLFGFAVIFAFRTLILWSTSNINLLQATLIGSIQPGLIISMLIVIIFLSTTVLEVIGEFSAVAFILNFIIACLILVVAIYSFVVVVESPMRRNMGLGLLELLSLFISHITEGSPALEGLFSEIGEPVDTLIGMVSFKSADKIKALLVSPSIHPGPVGSIGGGNMPYLLSEKFDFFTMVAHGPSTHDFNPVSSTELVKVEDNIRQSLEDINYSKTGSEFVRVQEKEAQLGVQFFGKDLLMLATFAPEGFDDIDFGVGLAMINLARSHCAGENVVLVDCHNCFKGEAGQILPGNKEVFHLMDAIEKMECLDNQKTVQAGCSHDPLPQFSRVEGIGQGGVKVLVVEVHPQKTAYILIDSNNMVSGFREKIIEQVKSLGIDEAEVMTTDTHSVNTLAGGHNPVGKKKKDEIISEILNCTKKAVEDLEPVSVGCKVSKIEDLKTLGPTHTTELVTTISSIVAVSRIFAPLVFILALIFVFVWTFYIT